MIVDSHCHLDRLNLDKYEGDLDRAIQEARKNDVGYLLTICVNLPEFDKILAIANSYPYISCSVGVHPSDHENEEVNLDQLIELAKHPKVVALGETGLDYFYNEKEHHTIQQINFRKHIQAGHAVNKPIIIHTRDAEDDTLMIMKEETFQQMP